MKNATNQTIIESLNLERDRSSPSNNPTCKMTANIDVASIGKGDYRGANLGTG